MTTLHRAGTVSTLALSGLAVVFGVSHTLAPEWTRRIGLDVWNLPSLRATAAQVEEESVETNAKSERLFQSIEAADHIIARLVAGNITLLQATDELEPLMLHRDGFDIVWEHYYKAKTFRDGVTRYAMERSLRMLTDDPVHKAQVSLRLDTEFAAMK
jgi:hypothetical protein